MKERNPHFPLSINGGKLTLQSEYIAEKSTNESIFTWTKLVNGRKSRQWLGFQSSEFRNKDLQFNAWIKFVKAKPLESDQFGLKVCGTFYNNFLTQCNADEWCFVEEHVHCNGRDSNHIILIFNDVLKKGQHVKMFGVTLKEIGKRLHNYE